ncbi:substrate-binding domain-containing protein [Paenibacillus gorillae]|uniref:GntR family transcriptional regulator n=1 Tax=Paenibacillus gorillae TaxID=1243662 RepID=UPI0004B364A1|nr:GntR family transcriptional regulator [Paenibacillus gorillae]
MKLQDNETKPLLYKQMVVKVLELIRSRKLRPHDPVPSEGELAKLYGVSRMTAKLAFDILVKEDVVYRLARRGTFLSAGYVEGVEELALPRITLQPEQPAKRKIAMVFPNMDDYTARIIASAEQEARKLNCQLLIRISLDKEDESECLQELYEDRVDGVILYPRGRMACSEKVLELNRLHYPLVIIDRIFREVQIDCVYHDHYQGAYNLVQYLIGKGHKEIGYISMSFDGVTSREDRYKGYLQALRDHKLTANEGYALLHCSEDYMSRLSEVNPQLKAFIGKNSALTAVVCADDYLATSCLYTALSMNVSVPNQLSVIGFSDIQLSSLLPIPLTTARQTTEQIGQAAINLLFKRMDKSREGAVTIKVKTSIIERSSVKTIG